MSDKQSRCSGCGFPRNESMAPGRDQAYDSEPLVCHACAVRDRARSAFQKNKGDTAGVHYPISERYPFEG